MLGTVVFGRINIHSALRWMGIVGERHDFASMMIRSILAFSAWFQFMRLLIRSRNSLPFIK